MLGLLQYTSGSTSDPKGVMVRHRNLLANLEAIRHGFNIDWQLSEEAESETGVFWLPAFHDMGLIGGILEPLYVGGHSVLMSPRSFLARPLRWLEAISRFGATTSGAPNFAYQLCVERAQRQPPRDIDLSRWQLAFCGAEPIRAETLAEFAKTFAPYGFENVSFYPCYGLAEATLLAAGGCGPNAPTIFHADREELGKGRLVAVPRDQANSATSLVSSGRAALHTEIRIVDPQTFQVQADGEIGEIWLAGASIAAGYLGRDKINAQLFAATLNSAASSSRPTLIGSSSLASRLGTGSGPYMRTGDLGALINGELYVTGRLKDVIILRGRNLYPQDIELKAIESVGEIAGQCAAFSVAGAFGEELAIVMEIARNVPDEELPQVGRKIRSAIVEYFEADVRHLRLVRPAAVPLTSSGKVQRGSCRELMRNGTLKVRWSWGRSALEVDGAVLPTPVLTPEASSAEFQQTTDLIQSWLIQWLIVRAGIPVEEALADRPFAEYGLDSLASVELSSELQDWLGIPLSPILAWNYPTPEKLAPHLAKLLAGIPVEEVLTPVPTSGAAEDIEDLLTQLEGLSDEEVQRVLSSGM
jgi:acyl-CoA synthetase (AMP-forming)/AMP-acid ligase II/acyl carrier protein